MPAGEFNFSTVLVTQRRKRPLVVDPMDTDIVTESPDITVLRLYKTVAREIYDEAAGRGGRYLRGVLDVPYIPS
jgi:hypothetical protein